MGLTTGTQEIIGDKTFTGKVKFKGKVEFKRENWTEVTAFENSWVNYSTSWDSAAYRKDVLGFIHLKGQVKNGTIGTDIFTLPVGYRPSTLLAFPAVSNAAFGYIQIRTNGTVACMVGNNASVGLTGITFYVG